MSKPLPYDSFRDARSNEREQPMGEMNETAFLRSIAEDNDNVGRLVLADWLEERGDRPRADFLRVQCDLASSDISEQRRRALRLRERELLDAHRQQWVQAFGLPLEDVCFQGGLIASMRLSHWEGGRMLDAEHAPRLATLTELDLSGLGIGDAGLTTFAETAHFPALRKLILSENGITDAGVAALGKSAGLPRLDTVYLFQNLISNRARGRLKKAAHFRLTNLDLGERAEGYCMSRGETEVARREYIRSHLLPAVSQYFQTYKLLQSAMLCVAQYWADEADDAVHGRLVVSELFEPTMEGVGWSDESARSDPNVPNTIITTQYGECGSAISLWEAGAGWDDNSRAIPLWAPYAPEGGHQEYGNLDEVYAPAMMFYRHGGYEFLPMSRPHLDGIRPEWGWDD
jgi:uncharacterized protein (TIGR02996 family)